MAGFPNSNQSHPANLCHWEGLSLASSSIPQSFSWAHRGGLWRRTWKWIWAPLCLGLSCILIWYVDAHLPLKMRKHFCWFLLIHFYGGYLFCPCSAKGETIHVYSCVLSLRLQPSDSFKKIYDCIDNLTFLGFYSLLEWKWNFLVTFTF